MIVLLALCLFVFLFLIWLRQVNLDLKGTEYIQLDESASDNVSIKIDGQINNKFFGAREFNGRIYCDAIDLNGEYFNLRFDDSNKSYLSTTKESGNVVNYGEIFTNKNMDELVIDKGDDILVFPSKNRKAAEEIANKYFSTEYNNHFNSTN